MRSKKISRTRVSENQALSREFTGVCSRIFGDDCDIADDHGLVGEYRGLFG